MPKFLVTRRYIVEETAVVDADTKPKAIDGFFEVDEPTSKIVKNFPMKATVVESKKKKPKRGSDWAKEQSRQAIIKRFLADNPCILGSEVIRQLKKEYGIMATQGEIETIKHEEKPTRWDRQRKRRVPTLAGLRQMQKPEKLPKGKK